MSTAEIEQNPSGHSAAEQGSEIPLRWKPTAQKPVPVVRCSQIKKDGERCKNWSLRGYVKCRKHAGPQALMEDGNVSRYSEAVIESARLRLVDNTDMAIETLEQLLQPGSSEGIRLKAATEVLDRAGVKGGFDIKVDVEVTENPAEVVRDRLLKLTEGAQAVEKLKRKAAGEDDIVDAEIVEDDPEQETLF
jgi:hypothetical protein